LEVKPISLGVMKDLPLVITLLVSVIITGEWSGDKSRQDSVLQEFLDMPLVISKSNRIKDLFAVSWPVGSIQ